MLALAVAGACGRLTTLIVLGAWHRSSSSRRVGVPVLALTAPLGVRLADRVLPRAVEALIGALVVSSYTRPPSRLAGLSYLTRAG